MILNTCLGVHPRCHPPYLVDLPDPRAQSQIGNHRLHDLIWRCPRIAWRVAFQPHRFPRSSCSRRRTSRFLIILFLFYHFFHSFRVLFGDANRPDSITVRSFASRNDSNSLTRSQDGPTCLAPLLRAGLRPHQPCHSPLHRGLRAILRACTHWPPYTLFQCRPCLWPQRRRRFPRRCRFWPCFDACGRI